MKTKKRTENSSALSEAEYDQPAERQSPPFCSMNRCRARCSHSGEPGFSRWIQLITLDGLMPFAVMMVWPTGYVLPSLMCPIPGR